MERPGEAVRRRADERKLGEALLATEMAVDPAPALERHHQLVAKGIRLLSNSAGSPASSGHPRCSM